MQVPFVVGRRIPRLVGHMVGCVDGADEILTDDVDRNVDNYTRIRFVDADLKAVRTQ